MGLFTSTFPHTQTTTLPPLQPPPSTPQTTSETRHETALSLLHDPAAIITLNPLVTNFEEVDPSTIDIKPLQPFTSNPTTSDLPDPPPQPTSSQPKYFRITDTKALLGGWYTAKFSYYISYLKVDGGCDTVVAAPGGVSIAGSWRVDKYAVGAGDRGEEELTLVESATITCPSIFAPFIKGTLGSSHEEMHARFVERWKDRLNG